MMCGSHASKVELKTCLKKHGPVPDTESTEVPDIAGGLKKLLCVCQSACLFYVSVHLCVWVFSMHCEQVYMHHKNVVLKENSVSGCYSTKLLVHC